MSAKPLFQPRLFQSHGNVQRERWTVSYVDVLTILLVLFVAAAAKSVAQPVTPSSAPEASLSESLRRLKARGLDAKVTKLGLVISLPQAVLFASGDEEIGEAALPLIQVVGEVLRDIPNRVRLAGYADNSPVHGGRFRDNWELAAARGLNLLDLLINEYGIDASRLSVESFGSQAPRDSNDTAQGRAANRRVEVLILNE